MHTARQPLQGTQKNACFRKKVLEMPIIPPKSAPLSLENRFFRVIVPTIDTIIGVRIDLGPFRATSRSVPLCHNSQAPPKEEGRISTLAFPTGDTGDTLPSPLHPPDSGQRWTSAEQSAMKAHPNSPQDITTVSSATAASIAVSSTTWRPFGRLVPARCEECAKCVSSDERPSGDPV